MLVSWAVFSPMSRVVVCLVGRNGLNKRLEIAFFV
jgi:hypothetical protein